MFRSSTRGRELCGYDATSLIDLCNAIKKAHNIGLLNARQENLYKNATLITDATAKYRIYRFIYDLCGFTLTKDEAIKLLQRFILEGAKKYETTFTESFYLFIVHFMRCINCIN